MLRSGAGILSRFTAGATETKCGPSSYALEFVRWRRKPRWLPVAKSKVFRVPERKAQDPEERAELQRLYNNYRTQMRSLMQYFREEAKRIEETSTADHIVLTPQQQEDEFQRCMRENDAWNAKIAEERAVRIEKERQETIAYVRERKELAKVREQERMAEIEERVRREKELSKTFITRENLEEAINIALANPVDYNFSIDLNGNMYHGRTTTPDGTGPSSAPKDDPEELEAQN